MRALTATHASYLNAQGIDQAVYNAACESITAADQLPFELRWAFERSGGGIAFHHTRPDGSTAIQYRPDKPADDRKYLWAEGVGAVLSVHPAMAERVGQAKRLVIVEGTKQGLVAVSNAAPDDLIVSIQGCWSWSSEGLPVRGWDALVADGMPVVISLDADWTTKRTVWDAAERLGGVLASLGAGQVSYVRLPAGSNTGLDDYLKNITRDKRAAVFTRLLDSAKAKLGRAPAAKRDKPQQMTSTTAGLAPVVDVAAGVIREADTTRADEFGSPVPVTGDVLLEAAVIIERTIVVRDDLRTSQLPDIQHDLAVYIGPDAHPIRIPAVADSLLGDIEAILRRDPSGRGTRVVRRPGRGVSEAIAAGIRATAAEAEIVTAYRRTGWVTLDDGTRGYLHAGGLLTADGNRDWPRAETSYNRIDLAQAAEDVYRGGDGYDDVALASAQACLDVPGYLPDATGYYAGVGGLAYVATGNEPRGGVYLIGGHGSGKTTIARMVASMLTADYAPESAHSMVSMQSTSTTISEAGAGLQHCLCMVDDVRAGTSRREQDRMMVGIDSVMRRAYEGGAVGRARQVWDAKAGTLRSVESDPTSPFMLMVGEVLPSAERFGSSVERVLTVELNKRRTGEADRMDLAALHRVSQDGSMARAFAGYLIWLADRGDQARTEAAERRGVIATKLAEKYPELTPRAVAVAAGPLAGWTTWCDYLHTVHQETAPAAELHAASERIAQTRRAGNKAIVEAMLRHSRVEMSGSQEPHVKVLAKLAEIISSGGRFRLLGMGDQGKETTLTGPGEEAIGKRTTVANAAGERVEVLALLPGVVAKAVREPSGEAVTRSLRSVAVLSATGETARTMRVGGTVTRVVCVPMTLWDGVEEPVSPVDEDARQPVEAY